jgi:glycyl-tRNA synthetase beta subunit
VVEAVLAEQGDNPYLAWTGAHDLEIWVDHNRSSFEELLPAYARTARIIPYTQSKGLAPDPFPDPDPEALEEPASQHLYEAYETASTGVYRAAGTADVFQAMLGLVEPINAFFDEVLVVAQDEAALFQSEEEARRHNLLALLQRIAELAKGWLDFSKLEGY